MGHWIAFLGILLTAAVGPAAAQSMYKCVVGGKTSYSDKPCEAGTQRTLSADGGPSLEERAAARARLSRELSQQASREEVRSAQQQAHDDAMASQRAMQPSRPPNDPRANERVMVHSPRGWDYKTRGQIEAEEAARAGRPVAPTGAAWESERVTTHGSSGWGRETRLEAAQREGTRKRRGDEMAREATSGMMVDQYGKQWSRNGGMALDPTTGRNCPVAGNMINCPR